MSAIISVHHLEKAFQVPVFKPGTIGALKGLFHRQYRTVRAVRDVSFEIQAGELVGYLGPNGAGKSTTLKILTGLLVPTRGEVICNSQIPWRERQTYVARIGAVFGQRTTLWWDLPLIESFDLLRHIYRIPKNRFHQNFTEFRKLLDLDRFIHTPVRSLSLGQRMRADLAAALLHDPPLIFLDEPTIGLDVVAKERIREFIRHINQDRGTTVILTTHDLSDVEKLCERVMIIDQGQLLYDGTLAALGARFGGKRRLLVDFAEEYPRPEIMGAELMEVSGSRAVYQFDRETLTASELIGRLSHAYRLRDLEVREPDIEATIRRIYEERLLAR